MARHVWLTKQFDAVTVERALQFFRPVVKWRGATLEDASLLVGYLTERTRQAGLGGSFVGWYKNLDGEILGYWDRSFGKNGRLRSCKNAENYRAAGKYLLSLAAASLGLVVGTPAEIVYDKLYEEGLAEPRKEPTNSYGALREFGKAHKIT